MRVAQDRDHWRALDKVEFGHRIALNLSNTKPRLRKQTTFKRESHVPQYRWSFNWWRHSVWNSTSFLRLLYLFVGVCVCVWGRICLTEEGRTWYRRFLDAGRCLCIICPRMERKFHNSAATPDGTLSRAKTYKTSYITRRNVLMEKAGALFCQTETENRGTGREREAIRRTKPVNYITFPLFLFLLIYVPMIIFM